MRAARYGNISFCEAIGAPELVSDERFLTLVRDRRIDDARREMRKLLDQAC